jgi:hypothetical protein
VTQGQASAEWRRIFDSFDTVLVRDVVFPRNWSRFAGAFGRAGARGRSR